ncbi:MAG: hypothetical protein QF789_09575 [Gammaproteobacteria bacterium]|jgi:hypothetical protein|nr:hypothetical protein [Chromatiales bacterium]MDP7661453.1 hypothetical protein [Gammaproteobacteria bacterium]HJP05678.1 hypothetical protein [Gammaproteobacteria bacterium]
MYPQAHIPHPSSELDHPAANKFRLLPLRKIWLPKGLYTILPVLYIGLGLYAISAALLLSQWTWIIPYILISGIVCLHAGTLIAVMRRRNRKGYSTKPGA